MSHSMNVPLEAFRLVEAPGVHKIRAHGQSFQVNVSDDDLELLGKGREIEASTVRIDLIQPVNATVDVWTIISIG